MQQLILFLSRKSINFRIGFHLIVAYKTILFFQAIFPVFISAPMYPKLPTEFRVNKPFQYFIVNKDRRIIFVGVNYKV